MAESANVEWCDSTLNLLVGCAGCELWNADLDVKSCYAGLLTEHYAGQGGWPERFDQPRQFPERMDQALSWSDLTGANRPDKPWLDRLPRIILLNDLGDTFTESLESDWLAPLLPRMTHSPHHWVCVTKRASRMLEFCETSAVPRNFWCGVSVTKNSNLRRATILLDCPAVIRFLVLEPILESIDLSVLLQTGRIHWVIVGGETGHNAHPTNLQWIRNAVSQCEQQRVPLFVRQLGSNPVRVVPSRTRKRYQRVQINDLRGADPQDWPEAYRVRQMPKLDSVLQQRGLF